MNTFKTGQVVQTRGIYTACQQSRYFFKEVTDALSKYLACDWGDTCQEDSELNNNAVATGNDRIVAKYKTSQGNIFIITEWDRSYTTILFADEY